MVKETVGKSDIAYPEKIIQGPEERRGTDRKTT